MKDLNEKRWIPLADGTWRESIPYEEWNTVTIEHPWQVYSESPTVKRMVDSFHVRSVRTIGFFVSFEDQMGVQRIYPKSWVRVKFDLPLDRSTFSQKVLVVINYLIQGKLPEYVCPE